MASVRLSHVSKRFAGQQIAAVDDVSLVVSDGEFLVLVGPSGSGKSTILRLVAGLETLSEGTVEIAGRTVNDLAPRQRDIAMVFQNYALYPHMSVERNMGFGLSRSVPKAVRRDRVREVARMLELDGLLNRKPAALSGGQRQRVAMGRAIVREPLVYLMDEPLSNLDAQLRVTMRSELVALHRRLGVTTLYVTHDQIEAMSLGQRVAVMRDGRLLQCDTPTQLFHRPQNLFVATFIGSPSMNWAIGRLEGGLSPVIRFRSRRLEVDNALATQYPSLAGYFGRDIVFGIRPSAFGVAAKSTTHAGTDEIFMDVDVEIVEDLGSELHAVFSPGDRASLTELGLAAALPREPVLWTAVLPPGSPLRAGGRARLAVKPGAIHLFDSSTGLALERSELGGPERTPLPQSVQSAPVSQSTKGAVR